MTASAKKKIVLSQTCQGLVLEELLNSSPVFRKHFACTFIPNYEIRDGELRIAMRDTLESTLFDCNLLIYHDIDIFDFPLLIKNMPPGSTAIKIPYISSTIYWPTYDYKNPCWLSPHGNTAHIPWPCLKLNELIVSLRDKRKVLDTYVNMNIAKVVRIDSIHAQQIAYLREAEKGSPFHISEFISRHIINEQLFYLINHPAIPVFLDVANTIFRYLELPCLQNYARDPFRNHQMPVHPSIIRYYNIPWCNENTKFTILDKSMHFEEYVNFYIDCYVDKYGYILFPPPKKPKHTLLRPFQKLKDTLDSRRKSRLTNPDHAS